LHENFLVSKKLSSSQVDWIW